MSNDQETIQKSTEFNSKIEVLYALVTFNNYRENLTGACYYWDFLINLNRIPLFLLIVGFGVSGACYAAGSLLGSVGAMIVLLCALVYANAYSVCEFIYPLIRSIQYFCRTPKEIFPHAALTVILSYVLSIVVPIGAFIYFAYNGFTLDSVAAKAVAVIAILLMYYCFFSFYSLLCALGKQITSSASKLVKIGMSSNICGIILLIVTTLCGVFDITAIFYTPSNENIPMLVISRIALSLINAIFLYVYVYKFHYVYVIINAYFLLSYSEDKHQENPNMYIPKFTREQLFEAANDMRYDLDNKDSVLGKTIFIIGGVLGVLEFIIFWLNGFPQF